MTLPARGTLIGLALAVVLLAAAGLMLVREEPADPAQPPIVMTCPHHPDVVESAPGTCPYCRMALVPVRLAQAWSCPIHPAAIAEEAGTCPICRRPLVRVTVTLTYGCPGSSEEQLEQGLCADGSPMAIRRTPRPHGDHNPRHGGQFFMAADNWHHVEGAYPEDGLFRLYVYDDYARPLPLEQLQRVRARVVTEERFDPDTGTTTELAAFPLSVAGGGAYLEGRIGAPALPASMVARVQITPDLDEQRFDFTFSALSRDPSPGGMDARMPMPATADPGSQPAHDMTHGAGPAPPSTSPAAAAAPLAATRATAADAGAATPPAPAPGPSASAPAAAAPTAAAPAAATAPVTAVPIPGLPEPDPALTAQPIADTIPGMLDQLRTRNAQIAGLIERGDLAAVWFPAFQAKDVAVALEGRLDAVAPARRDAAAAALQRLVRMAWLIDAHGDTGNRRNVAAAHAAFSSALDEVLANVREASR